MSRSQRFYQLASLVLFCALLLLVGATFQRYGISWDEGTHEKFGTAILNYYRSLARGQPDNTVLSIGNPVAYGGVFNLTTAFLQERLPFGRFESRHLVNALVGVLGILGAWMLARLAGGEKAAFWAALFLAITPAYYGHMFFNPKDIPFSTGYIWSLFFILLSLIQFPKINWLTIFGLGAAIGFTMGVRVGGVMLLGYLGLAWLVKTTSAWFEAKSEFRWLVIWKVILSFILVCAIAYVNMVIFWPWALQDPLVNPLKALTAQQEIDYQGTVLYRGIGFPADKLPLDYIPGYLLVVLPEVVLLMLAAGLAMGCLAVFRTRIAWRNPSRMVQGVVLLLLAVVFPVGYAMIQRPVLYDGIRHFTFLLLPIACLAGLSFRAISERLERKPGKWSLGFTLATGALCLLQVINMARLFPYEYIYYNALAGGIKGAQGRYELDYWGLSTSEAARWLSGYAESKPTADSRKVPVYTCAGKDSVKYFLPNSLGIAEKLDLAHYGILLNRSICEWDAPGKVLFTVERSGVPLATVKELY